MHITLCDILSKIIQTTKQTYNSKIKIYVYLHQLNVDPYRHITLCDILSKIIQTTKQIYNSKIKIYVYLYQLNVDLYIISCCEEYTRTFILKVVLKRCPMTKEHKNARICQLHE